MQITAIKTRKITTKDHNLFKILDKYIVKDKRLMINDKKDGNSGKFYPFSLITHHLQEGSILVITSKIVSITQGRVVKINPKIDKDKLIQQESEYYLPRSSSKFHTMITIKDNVILGGAGIDASNGNGYFILLPKYLQKTANRIRMHLAKRLGFKKLGVIITDSRSLRLRRGTIGTALAHSGFNALKSYKNKKDIFGRKFLFEVQNISDALAAAAVGVMGEGKEQTPLAIIEDVPYVEFQQRDPSKKELSELNIPIEDDLFAPILTSVKWKKGGK